MYIYIHIYICITPLVYNVYIYTRADTGGGNRGLSPPWAISGGGLSPPWGLSPAWAIQGGDSKNVHPLSDSGGGQNSLRGGTNKFSGASRPFCPPPERILSPPVPPLRSSGGGQKFFWALRARFVPPLSKILYPPLGIYIGIGTSCRLKFSFQAWRRW